MELIVSDADDDEMARADDVRELNRLLPRIQQLWRERDDVEVYVVQNAAIGDIWIRRREGRICGTTTYYEDGSTMYSRPRHDYYESELSLREILVDAATTGGRKICSHGALEPGLRFSVIGNECLNIL